VGAAPAPHAARDHNCDNDDQRADDVLLVPLEPVVDLDDVLAGEDPDEHGRDCSRMGSTSPKTPGSAVSVMR
jgi:hypothetical protein